MTRTRRSIPKPRKIKRSHSEKTQSSKKCRLGRTNRTGRFLSESLHEPSITSVSEENSNDLASCKKKLKELADAFVKTLKVATEEFNRQDIPHLSPLSTAAHSLACQLKEMSKVNQHFKRKRGVVCSSKHFSQIVESANLNPDATLMYLKDIVKGVRDMELRLHMPLLPQSYNKTLTKLYYYVSVFSNLANYPVIEHLLCIKYCHE
nr:expressed protein [Hymenolepis microstoma]